MKKSFLITFIVLMLVAVTSGLVIGIASRIALFDVFIAVTPAVPLFPETNILVLGVDDAFGHRSDTIMVLHVNPAKKEVSLISIPRDTIAVIPNRGLDKINHSYAYGGVELTRRTVEDLLHVSIPYYVTVNLAGIAKIIDDLGGVTANVEKRMYYVDYAADLHIDLQPGLQKLNGQQAMGYLRFRHTDNDFARINRQQNFLRQVAVELLKKENVLRSPNLFLSLLSCIDTNLNSRETLGLSLTLRGACELGQVYMTTVPGSDMMVDNIYYWKPDEAALQRIVEQFITGKQLASSG